jgi:cytochrome c oxidase cbb3-type subunit 3
LALASAVLCACDRHDTQASYAPAAQQEPQVVVVSALYPGGGTAPPEDPRGKIYDGDAYHIAQGQRYFTWYNCSGCHFNGGGGIGPAFMDKVWLYGGRIDQIYNSIAEGRPNGMPTWRGKIPDAQIWEIAAYVRSLSTPQVKDENPPSTPPPIAQLPADPNHQGGTLISEATVGPRPQ